MVFHVNRDVGTLSHKCDEGNMFISNLCFSGSKMTPRSTNLNGPQLHTPPPLASQAVSTSNLYQYSFPNVVKMSPQHAAQGLSVVSAPVPVAHRPELSSAGSRERERERAPALAPQHTLEGISGLRSTKSQRIRGASNNIRMKQLEMRENHAVVFS